MITSDKRPQESNFVNITDYSAVCPKGLRSFFAYAHFTDNSHCLFSNIFAANRTGALLIALNRFPIAANIFRVSASRRLKIERPDPPSAAPTSGVAFAVFYP